jgi:hypothetical protein
MATDRERVLPRAAWCVEKASVIQLLRGSWAPWSVTWLIAYGSPAFHPVRHNGVSLHPESKDPPASAVLDVLRSKRGLV